MEQTTVLNSESIKSLVGDKLNDLTEMMNPFYTTQKALVLASSTIKKHGGRLYYNDKSKNTQFVFEFPILQSE
jgi:hypothetical protein